MRKEREPGQKKKKRCERPAHETQKQADTYTPGTHSQAHIQAQGGKEGSAMVEAYAMILFFDHMITWNDHGRENTQQTTS